MDSIAAIATPCGAGGICVLRISGGEAIEICQKLFRADLLGAKSHTVLYGFARTAAGEKIDECLVSVFRAPKTFTRENTVEISCHGGRAAANKILTCLFEAGARLAEPGEFTMRAFLNGRVDLSQAEAVNDIITARSDAALCGAVNQLEGSVSREINALRNRALSLAANLQAAADFPEEELGELTGTDVAAELSELEGGLRALLETAKQGRMVKEGVLCAIVGRPNTGKSSLLNRLLGQGRAIVTDIAGTTRDVIEETIQIGGVALRLADTAGLRETGDVVEAMGVEKTRQCLNEADLCLLVLDASAPLEKEDEEIIALVKEKNSIVVYNKCDKEEKIKAQWPKGQAVVRLSAKTGWGVGDLEEEIAEKINAKSLRGDKAVLTNLRHQDAVARALSAVSQARASFAVKMPADMVSIDIEAALSALGEVTGMTVSQEIVHEIFGKFCLGK